jgi:hypothetical protein
MQVFPMYLRISIVSKEVCCTWYEVKSKRGKGICMGRINEKDHAMQLVGVGKEANTVGESIDQVLVVLLSK